MKFQELTYNERMLIEKYIRKGCSLSEISKLIKRSKNGVSAEVRKNGGREEYGASVADNQARIRKEERIKRLKKNTQIGEHPYTSLKNRVENLEMQVQILSETLIEIQRKSR